MVTDAREYNPKAFQVFGPKLIATRGEYDDRALESRFLTEEMGRNRLRDDVPINLPPEYAAEALKLRNKLLSYRLRNFHRAAIDPSLIDPALEPRLNQIFVPLKSIVDDKQFQHELARVGRDLQASLIASRGFELETQMLEVIRDLLDSNAGAISLKAITSLFLERHGDQYDYKITHRWIGGVLRRKLHLQPVKGHSTYVIPVAELPHLGVLFSKFGVDPKPPHTNGQQTVSGP